MTEDGAQAWLATQFGSPAAERIATLLRLVVQENERQNLIAHSTLGQMWSRHALDSAQLVLLADPSGLWLDVGTGGGFPGLIVALLREEPVLLVEPRRKRAEFLTWCVAELGLAHVQVEATKVELLTVDAAVISARAVASIENLLQAALPCSKLTTRWLLPRGRLSAADLADVGRRWTGVFHVEQSLSEDGSSILIADGVRPR